MKPKFRRLIKKALPTWIVLPALMNVATAAVIVPDSLGNVLVTGNFSGAATVSATGGSTSPFTVTIQNGASLTGDSFLQNGVNVNSANYTINNSGSLNVAQRGIQSSDGTLIINNLSGGLIQGANDGIHFNGNGGTVVNNGTIAGITGIYSDGIKGQNNLRVTNNLNISGKQQGVDAGNGLILTNNFTLDNAAPTSSLPTGVAASITGNTRAGVEAGNGATINNYSIISSSNSDGVKVRDGASITNFTTTGSRLNGSGNVVQVAVIGGSIIGSSGDGIDAGNGLVLVNQGLGIISGLRGNGIVTRDNASITNDALGSITGSVNGITAGAGLILSNSGTITGTNNDGVNTQDGATITNYSTGVITGQEGDGIQIIDSKIIIGALAPDQVVAPDISASTITNFGEIIGISGDGIRGSNAVQTVNNYGYISGTNTAINLYNGADIINLYDASEVHGNIYGGDGLDALNFHGGATNVNDANNIVYGSVYEMETINKYDSGTAFIGSIGAHEEVFTNTINVLGGGLTINGNVFGLDGKANIHVTGGEIGGTGTWNANIDISNGGISAGATPIDIAGNNSWETHAAVQPRGTSIPRNNESAVGTLTLTGDVTHLNEEVLSKISSRLLGSPTYNGTYIREDIISQAPIINGVNSDLIVQNGINNTYDVTGADVLIAPTNVNKTLTDGAYTIIDSDMPIVGFNAIGKIGVYFSKTALDTGAFFATEGGHTLRASASSNVSFNTVLGKYFSTLGTTDLVSSNADLLSSEAGSTFSGNSNLVLTIKHNFEGLPGLTPNQSSLGGALDDLAKNSRTPLIQDFISALDLSDLNAVRDSISSLDPGNELGLTTSIVNSNYRLHRLTQEHLFGVREGGESVTETSPSSKDAKGLMVPGTTTTRTTGRGNAWGSVSYDSQKYDAAGSLSDYDGDTGSFTAGFDYRLAPQFVLGLVLDGSKSSFDGQGFSSDIDSFRGAIYGTWGSAMGLYSDFLVGYGDHSLDSSRVLGGVLSGLAVSNTNANSLQALWTFGYTMGDDKIKHGPFAGLEYQNVSVDGFTESSVLPVTVSGYEIDSLRALIGYRVNANFGMFRPYATVAYAHEFQDGANRATASIGGSAFSVTGAEQSSAFLVTAGTGISINSALSLDVGYRGEIATDDGITSHGGTLGLNYSF
jgi:uncharacterized protein YhjY with autotransporter beta-barrel domain